MRSSSKLCSMPMARKRHRSSRAVRCADYETFRKLALDSSGTDLAELNQLTVLIIFQLRYILEKSRLEKISGRELFEWGVASGLIDKNSVNAFAIHKVQYEGDTAYATVSRQGKFVTDVMFTFRKEDGEWKLDLMELARVGGDQLDKIRKEAGKTKVEMAVFLLEKQYGEEIPPRILDGPLK